MSGLTKRSAAHARAQRSAANEAAQREAVRQAKETWTYHLYRCYDAEDRLLYIGCTQDVVSRMAVHAAAWGNPASAYLNLHMDRYETEEIVGFSAARKAEREAIAAEAPLLNVHYNKGRGAPRVPVKPPTREELDAYDEAISNLFADPSP